MGVTLTAGTLLEMKNHIANILFEHGESFINDGGVDTVFCDDVADEIMQYIKRCMMQANLSDLEARI